MVFWDPVTLLLFGYVYLHYFPVNDRALRNNTIIWVHPEIQWFTPHRRSHWRICLRRGMTYLLTNPMIHWSTGDVTDRLTDRSTDGLIGWFIAWWTNRSTVRSVHSLRAYSGIHVISSMTTTFILGQEHCPCVAHFSLNLLANWLVI